MNWFEKVIDGISNAFGSIFGGSGSGDLPDTPDMPDFTAPDYEGPLERTIDDAVDSFRSDEGDWDDSWITDRSSDAFVDWAREYSVSDPSEWSDAKITIGPGGITLDYTVDGEQHTAEYDDIHAFFDEVYDELYEDYEVDFDVEDEYSSA